MVLSVCTSAVLAKVFDKRKCPEVRAVPYFDLSQTCKGKGVVMAQYMPVVVYWPAPRPQMLGDWYVVEYYASEEEALSYSCMRSAFIETDQVQAKDGSVELTPGVTMKITYQFAGDPVGETLLGNITWRVDLAAPAHWTHEEKEYDGVYNTYVLDTEYRTWALLLHCAVQREGARYLSAFVLSRAAALPRNVMAYLRDKLPRYDVDVNYVFPISHQNCSDKPANGDLSPLVLELGRKAPTRDTASGYKHNDGH